MTQASVGAATTLRLLLGAAVRRWLRSTHIARSRKNAASGARTATARKSGVGLGVLMTLGLPLFALQSFFLSAAGVQRLAVVAGVEAGDGDVIALPKPLHRELVGMAVAAADPAAFERQLADVPLPGALAAHRERLAAHLRARGLPGFVAADEPMLFCAPQPCLTDAGRWRLVAHLGGFLSLLFLGLVAIGFAGAGVGLAGPDWHFAWLATFPAPMRALVMAKVGEYALMSVMAWFTVFPLLVQTSACLGSGSPWLLAFAGTSAFVLVVGACRFALETALRLRTSLRGLRSAQGACQLVGVAAIFATMGAFLGESTPTWSLWLGGLGGGVAAYAPFAWPLAAAVGADGAAAAGLAALAAAAIATVACASWLLREGVMQSGGVDPGRRHAGAGWITATRRLGIAGKDFVMLLRDRSVFAQAILAPVMMIGLQLVINDRDAGKSFMPAAGFAFLIGAYAMLFGCFHLLASEGRSLWLLYTLPQRLGGLLARKAWPWIGCGLLFAALALVLTHATSGGDGMASRLAWDLAWVAPGIVAAGYLAAGIAVLGARADGCHVPRQMRMRDAMLYMSLAGLYLAALLQDGLAPRLGGLVAFGTLAFGVWQRAGERLPTLLDPIEEHRSRIVLYDGAMAVNVFLLLQTLVALIAMASSRRSGGMPAAATTLVAFAIAGAIVVGVWWLLLRMRGVEVAEATRLWREDATGGGRALAGGAAVGAAAAGLAAVYLGGVRAYGWFELPAGLGGHPDFVWYVVLAVVAAPLVEETLFRGFVLRGLAATTPRAVAVLWSAALFAVVHPVPAWAPVFVLGLGAAWIVERTRWLPPAMVAHAIYNAIVVLWLQ